MTVGKKLFVETIIPSTVQNSNGWKSQNQWQGKKDFTVPQNHSAFITSFERLESSKKSHPIENLKTAIVHDLKSISKFPLWFLHWSREKVPWRCVVGVPKRDYSLNR
jgi:hypothetical protein